jgi:predicted RNA-binding Zn-ribbon protein involved in translation (DUF1610 family)
MEDKSIGCFIKGFTKDWEEGILSNKEFISLVKNELEKVENNMKCPRCKENELHEDLVMNALSRKDNKTYICSDCGNEEAMEEFLKSGY